MDITLQCYGASQEVGRSAFILKTDKNILLDYGIKVFGKDDKPEYPLPIKERIDIALLSHAHLDHSGFIPYIYRTGNIPWYATPPTIELCKLLWKDSMKIMGAELPYQLQHMQSAIKYWRPALYGQNIDFGETTTRYLDAGHIAGSAMIELYYKRKRIVYTGDFKMEETRLHKGAQAVEDASVVIIDSTYAMKEHPPRKEAEKKIMQHIKETTESGGTALFPAFSLGRTQELIQIIRAYDRKIPVYVDGMGRDISRIYAAHPRYIKEGAVFRKYLNSVRLVQGPHDRKNAVREPGVIISSAGMMEGGPVLGYIQNVNKDSKIIFSGYTVKGTNGWKLINEGYITVDEEDLEVDLPVEYVDLSAHAGRSDILNFIKHANPEKVVIVHSDAAEEFKKDLVENFGYDALAPAVGETLKL